MAANKTTSRMRKAIRNGGARRGSRLRYGKGWQLLHRNRLFSGSLLYIINTGSRRLALFSIPKAKGEA
jgi:hypothetical protein